jgi:phage recombination protein Bet
MSDTALQKAEPQGIEAWQSKLDLIKQTVAKGATNTELDLFLYTCNRTGLDPLAKQIYAIKRKSKQGDQWVDTLTIQTGIDGYRLIAERTGKYEGQEGPFWCGPDGEWLDVWLKKEPPSAAKIGVLKAGFRSPLWGVARFDAYKQTRYDKEQKCEVLMGLWAKMPDVMIAKVAEALALRRAFPQDLSGIYTSEEMQQADTQQDERPPAPQPVAVQSRTNPKAKPSSSKAKSEDVKCAQCGGINGHEADCPTKQPKPKQAEGQVLEPENKNKRGWMYVAEIQERSTKGIPAKGDKPAQSGRPFLVLKCTDRQNNKWDIYVWHKTLMENKGRLERNWVEMEISAKTAASDASKTLYSLEKVHQTEDQGGITVWRDNTPLSDEDSAAQFSEGGMSAEDAGFDTP